MERDDVTIPPPLLPLPIHHNPSVHRAAVTEWGTPVILETLDREREGTTLTNICICALDSDLVVGLTG